MTEKAARLGLPKAMRLKETFEFAEVREKGSRLTKGCLIANWKPLAEGLNSKLGVITSRKVGKAVVRTRARRLLREAFRLHQHDLRVPVALVLVARASIAGKLRPEVERDLLSVLKQANLLKSTK